MKLRRDAWSSISKTTIKSLTYLKLNR